MAFPRYAREQLAGVVDVCASCKPQFGNRDSLLGLSSSKTNGGGLIASAFPSFIFIPYSFDRLRFFRVCYLFCSLLWLFFFW